MKKRLLSILLTLCIALSLLPVASFAAQTQIKVGDYLQFGQFEGKPIVWQVIHQEGDKLLLFSSEVLFWGEYDASISEILTNNLASYRFYGSCDWEHSDVRQYLNSSSKSVEYKDTEFDYSNLWHGLTNLKAKDNMAPSYKEKVGFLNVENFTSAEKSMIVSTSHVSIIPETHPKADGSQARTPYYSGSSANVEWGTITENYDSTLKNSVSDSVFLLNAEEVQEYLVENGFPFDVTYDRQSFYNRAYWLRDAVGLKKGSYEYWGVHAMTVQGSTQNSGSPSFEDATSNKVGIRPACYITLNKQPTITGSGTLVDPYVLSMQGAEESTAVTVPITIKTGIDAVDKSSSLPIVGTDWDDAWFAKTAEEYNHDLAIAAITLSSAAYIEKGQSVKDALTKLHFKENDIKSFYNIDYSKGNDYVAYTLAEKEIQVDGKSVPIVAIIIRGTPSNDEWYSNFNIGQSGGEHLGFSKAKGELMANLDQFLKSYDKKDIRYFVTGHSRGAGVANLVAADLIGKSYAPKSRVFAYTFASPTVSTSATKNGFESIFNIVNPEDFVPQLPLTKWNYKRYGIDRILPSRSFYGGSILGAGIFPDKEKKRSFDYVSGKMIKEFYQVTKNTTTFMFYGNGMQATQKLTSDVYNLAQTTKDVYEKQHYLFEKMPNSLSDATNRIFIYKQRLTDSVYCTMSEYFNILGGCMAGDKDFVTELLPLTSYGDYGPISRFFIWYGAGGITGVVANGQNGPLRFSHCEATYLSWLKSCSESELFQFEPIYKQLNANCPVDVYVYDEADNLVASVVNEETVADTLAVSVEDGNKKIDLPNDQEYRIEIRATDDGTVNYTVRELSGSDGIVNELRTVGFDPISITEGDALTGSVDNIRYTEADNYSLTKNGEKEIEPSEDSHHCSAKSFDDVDLSKWYHEGIDYAVITGMMNGVGDNKFNPDGTTTRGMVVTILHRLEGEPVENAARFTDVQSGSWYANAVNWASANGIVTGTSATTFAPNAPVTREQLATILYRYSQFKKYETASKADLSSFRDYASIGVYAKDGLGWAVNAGLINGVGDNLLSPTGSATRAQVATILMRFSEGVARGQ